ncbi:MAG: class I SAM-dependent methyltransferase [Cellvibrionaceae bacterium]
MKYPRVISRLSIIEPYIKGKDVLDIGCVDSRPGDVRKFESTGLHKFIKLHAGSLQGVDIDGVGAREMTQKGYNVVEGNAENMNLGKVYDTIVAGEIIEHLNNAGLFLETMRKHLKDGGTLIITAPNAFSISNFSRIIRKNSIKVHPDHTCWYDPLTIHQLVSRYDDLDIESIYFTNKAKWYNNKYFYKVFRYQLPKLISWCRPYFSGTIIAIIKKNSKN